MIGSLLLSSGGSFDINRVIEVTCVSGGGLIEATLLY